ncbi:AAA domain-containing protein [Palleronia aestuarii]|uniref:AAA domain-containing protein n=1 Tax=Palleronia aestuarii TaxID=568105 RepID=A0A2W7N2M4_9RHOB|nr:AAA domain-containing protein [Palleronia aestuarii]
MRASPNAELDRHLGKHIFDADEHDAVKARVLGRIDVLALHDTETGRAVGRYTTRGVRNQERAALADGAVVAAGRHRALSAAAQGAGLRGRTLREDQRSAFDHAVGARGLVLVEGRAGTGKSYTLGAIRDAHEAAGYAVVGLAPTNAVAQDLKADGFGRSAGASRSAGANRTASDGPGPGPLREGRAATVHSELFRLKNGHVSWDARTLVVVDEAAMLDARVTGELLAEARRSGAKVLFAGDDRQLASIERGGLFPELKRRHGAVEIVQVTRQRVDWQRQAARDLSEGRTYDAIAAFANNGALHWSGRQAGAEEALVARWRADSATDPQATRFVFAYTNREVDALNARLRAVRKGRGELGDDVRLETTHGAADFAVGDRVQVTETLRTARLWNGNAGVITGIDADTGRITARLDGAGTEPGREVSWRASEFTGFRHGYAGTIYKGQGKTIDHTYLLHSAHWRQASSYVALTRQRESARVFAATETATDLGQLARQMSRREVRAASIAWATREELPELRPAEGVRPAAGPAGTGQGETKPTAERSEGRVAPAATGSARCAKCRRAALADPAAGQRGADRPGGAIGGRRCRTESAARTGGARGLPPRCLPQSAKGPGTARRPREDARHDLGRPAD